MSLILNLLALTIAVVFHEVAHGYIAYRCGDPTAKYAGRLTLNPIAHIDVIGSIIIPGLLILAGSPFLIGWAKPVPINPIFFQNHYRDMMWVAIAGPLTNFSIATLCSILLKTPSIGHFSPILTYFLISSIYINIVLGVFNLFPIPPLDGSRILAFFSPQSLRNLLDKLEPYGFLIIFLLLSLGVFGKLLPLLIKPLVEGLT
jgi:Zn-dependent protease